MNHFQIQFLLLEHFCDIESLELQLQPIDAWDAETLISLWQTRDSTGFGALGVFDGKKLVSYLVYQVLDVAEVLRVGTHPHYQGRGLAKKLLSTWFDELKDLNIDVLLEVRADNLAAIHLYQSLGFQLIHVRKNYYKNPHNAPKTDAWIMQKADTK